MLLYKLLLSSLSCDCMLVGCNWSREDPTVGRSSDWRDWWPRQVHLHYACWVRGCSQAHQAAWSCLHHWAGWLHEHTDTSQSCRPASRWQLWFNSACCYCLNTWVHSHRRRRWGGGRGACAPKKFRKRYFWGNYYVKFGHFSANIIKIWVFW